ncbi:unnamed protein product, partial [Amoebophrya sp. A120]
PRSKKRGLEARDNVSTSLLQVRQGTRQKMQQRIWSQFADKVFKALGTTTTVVEGEEMEKQKVTVEEKTGAVFLRKNSGDHVDAEDLLGEKKLLEVDEGKTSKVISAEVDVTQLEDVVRDGKKEDMKPSGNIKENIAQNDKVGTSSLERTTTKITVDQKENAEEEATVGKDEPEDEASLQKQLSANFLDRRKHT